MRTTRSTGRRRGAVAVLCSVLLLAGGVWAPNAVAAPPQITIEPANAGDSAVHDAQQVDVSGTATGDRISAARFLGTEDDGDVVFQDLAEGVLNRVATPPNDFLRVDLGRVSGRLTLPCLFGPPPADDPVFDPAEPCSTHGPVRLVALEVTIAGEAGASNRLRVDYTRPVVRQYEAVTTTRIRVAFSEPVRHRQGDSPSDFTVTSPDRNVVAVEESPGGDCAYRDGEDRTAGPDGCTRTLVLDRAIGEDDRPFVKYTASDGRVPGREKYSDFASNQVLGFLSDRAVDEVLPRVPTFESVAGRSPEGGEVTGTQPAPTVRLGTITDGHTARVYREVAGGEGLQVEQDQLVGSATASDGFATVQLEALPADGTYQLYAVAQDLNGNTSAESQVRYVLDATAPRLDSAVITAPGEVEVRFNEPVQPESEPKDWTVTGGQVTGVSGSGASRTLTVTGAAPGATVAYRPVTTDLQDGAGNPVQQPADAVLLGVEVPVVKVPEQDLYTTASTATVAGTAQAGRAVDLHDDGDGDGRLDDGELVVTTTTVAPDGTWSVELPLPDGSRQRLVAVARDAGSSARSAGVPVPLIVQDAVRPELAVSRPAAADVLSAGSTSSVAFETRDANRDFVVLEITTDGTTWRPLARLDAPDGAAEVPYEVPQVDTASAQVRVTAVDLAKNSTTVLSDVFRIDGVTPRFTALTTAPREVRVTFNEPVTGLVGNWRIGSSEALLASSDGSAPSGLVRVTRARVLVFQTQDFGPDGEPDVTYEPAPTDQLRDASSPGNVVAAVDRITTARDGIRPAVPSITSVDENAPSGGLVRGDDPAPTVRVSGLQPDNDVWVEVVATGERGAVVRSSGSTAALRSPALPTQGEHVLRVVAQDPTGNLSTDTTKEPGTADGSPNPVTYALDSIDPVLLTAGTESGKVRVRFSEPVQPDGGTPSDWRLTDPDRTVTAVEGTGDSRLLTVSGPPAGAQLTYRPTGTHYADPTGNPVADTTRVVDGLSGDAAAPQITVRTPAAGAVLAGGSPGAVDYSTSDDNPGRLDLEITTDGGSTWSPLGTVTDPANGDGSFPFTVPDVETEAAQVRVTAVDRAGNTARALSPVFTIDALNPTFVALTTAPRTVRLTFSEPVSGRVSPLTDFRVDGQPATVTSIEGSPSTTADRARTLTLTTAAAIGEDARPTVTYAPSPVGQLVDRAQQPVVERVVTAVDGIRPAVPTVTAVDGRAPQDGRVLGGNVVPQVSVSNLVAGQFVRVERVPAAGLPVAGPEVGTQDGTVLVPAPRLPDDGEHVLRVVVRDPAGNTSTDTAKTPGRGDGGPATVTYVLDTQLPAVLFAVADDDEITVRFTEALFPSNGDPADWRVTRADGSPVPLGDGSVTVVAVRGAGDTRVLQATGVQPGSLLVYAPAGERYTDANANPLPDTTTPLLALEPPVVTTPARALLVTTGSTTVAGTSQPGSTVSLLRRGRDGGPSGAAVATARTGDDGRWSLTAPLDVDRANDFLVQAQRTDGRTTIAVPVPTITQDGAAPVLSVDGLPGDQQRLAPGSARTLSWSVCDANLGATPMVIEFSADDGASWSRLGPERLASPNDCRTSTSRRVTLPGTGETTSARLRLSAVDLAGRTTRIVSPRFVLVGETQVRDVTGYACPIDQVRPAGFTDTSTSTFRFEIDCLAAYAFTKGVTADRYEPLGNVTRAQMALFVARVAAYASVPLDTSDAGFTDIAGRSRETRDAINALANLDVVEGVGGGRYAPAAPVSRGQMASFLARVQQRVGTPFAGSRNAFRDDDRTTHEANIDLIAGAGIVQGTAPGTYQPLAPITRQQMAGFLVRYVDGQIEAGELRSAY